MQARRAVALSAHWVLARGPDTMLRAASQLTTKTDALFSSESTSIVRFRDCFGK
jgi:hypothetical protein